MAYNRDMADTIPDGKQQEAQPPSKSLANGPPFDEKTKIKGVSPYSGFAPPEANRWKPGQSGNPGGQARGKKVSTRMQELMTLSLNELDAILLDPTREVRDHLAAKAIKRAMKNDDANADLNTVMDRTEGKVSQDITVRAGQAPTLTDAQLAGIANGTLDPASLTDMGPRINEARQLPSPGPAAGEDW